MGDLAQIKIKKMVENAIIPVRATPGSSGYDLYCTETTDVYLRTITPIKTGVAIELPYGYEAQVRSRSGLAMKNQIFVLNSPGTIDSDYRGEIVVLLFNAGWEHYTIQAGERIAQLVFAKIELPDLQIVSELNQTERGIKGFGSTDKKRRSKKENVEGLAEGIHNS